MNESKPEGIKTIKYVGLFTQNIGKSKFTSKTRYQNHMTKSHIRIFCI